jgi:hypothetical protein
MKKEGKNERAKIEKIKTYTRENCGIYTFFISILNFE